MDRGTGKVETQRFLKAVDVGLVVNPDGAHQQVEGAITMCIGQALSEEIRFKGGRILNKNFDTYLLPRFSAIPRIQVVSADNAIMASQGIGEPPVVPVAAALANAVFNATGARVTHVPFTPERVLEALKLFPASLPYPVVPGPMPVPPKFLPNPPAPAPSTRIPHNDRANHRGNVNPIPGIPCSDLRIPCSDVQGIQGFKARKQRLGLG